MKAYEFVKTQKEIDDLVDVWRHFNPKECRFTWFRSKPELIMVRLDLFLISEPLIQLTDSVGITPGHLSDHAMISVSFFSDKSERGLGFWKLNTSLLEEETYLELIRNTINHEKTKNYESERIWWEMIKMEIRGLQSNTPHKRKSRHNLLNILENRLVNLEKELIMPNPVLNNINEQSHWLERILMSY